MVSISFFLLFSGNFMLAIRFGRIIFTVYFPSFYSWQMLDLSWPSMLLEYKLSMFIK